MNTDLSELVKQAAAGDSESGGETESAGQECSGTEAHPKSDFRGSRHGLR